MLSRSDMFGSQQGAAASAAPTINDNLQLTFDYALRVWWAYYWPTSVISFVAVAVMAFWLRAFAGLAFPMRFLPWAIRALPYVVTYSVAIFVIRYVLGKRFRHFRVSLLPVGANSSVGPLPRTLRRTIRVWWAFSWRALVYSLIVTAVAMFPLGWLLAALSLMGGFAAALSKFVLGAMIAAGIGMYVFYSNILEEDFGDFRVCLVPREAAGSVPDAALGNDRVVPAGRNRT